MKRTTFLFALFAIISTILLINSIAVAKSIPENLYGVWVSPDKNVYYEFFSDGTLSYREGIFPNVGGRWVVLHDGRIKTEVAHLALLVHIFTFENNALVQHVQNGKITFKKITRDSLTQEKVVSPPKSVVTDANSGRAGQPIDVKQFIKPGQTTIINFYSNKCPPCKKLAPMLSAMNRPKTHVVNLNIDRPNASGIDFDSPLAKQYNLTGIPHLMVFDEDGRLKVQGKEALAMVVGWCN